MVHGIIPLNALPNGTTDLQTIGVEPHGSGNLSRHFNPPQEKSRNCATAIRWLDVSAELQRLRSSTAGSNTSWNVPHLSLSDAPSLALCFLQLWSLPDCSCRCPFAPSSLEMGRIPTTKDAKSELADPTSTYPLTTEMLHDNKQDCCE